MLQGACVQDAMKLKVQVRGEWFTCEYDFFEFDIRIANGAFTSTIQCPSLSTACPDLLFCPSNCTDSGTCNFTNVDENNMVRPKCECFDEFDTSEDCSRSRTPPPTGPFSTVSPTTSSDSSHSAASPLIEASPTESPSSEPTPADPITSLTKSTSSSSKVEISSCIDLCFLCSAVRSPPAELVNKHYTTMPS